MLEKLIDVVRWSEKKCIEPILCELKYATPENFLGRVVAGYTQDAQDVGLITQEAAEQLCKAQDYFIQQHHASILIYDSLRPLRAVKDFTRWLDEPPQSDYELLRKQLHYPHIEKNQIAPLGYVAPNVSRHCFGNVVDMSLVSMNNGKEFNMGAIFDYFDDLSHSTVGADRVGKEAFANRTLLIDGMAQFGFKVHPKEYWHFEYQCCEVNEPFDLEISSALRGLNVK